MLAGVLIGAIPAWLYITGEFLRRAADDWEDRKAEKLEPDPLLENALHAAEERARDAQRHWERLTQSLQEKSAQIAIQVAEAEQRAFQAQQDATRTIKTAQARAERAERRAQNTAYAYERLKRKREASR